MKLKSVINSLFITSIIILTACDYNDDSGQPIDNTPTTFEIISRSEDHTILEQALIDTGLDETLNTGIYTIFAPDDDAFNDIDISGLSNDEITNILLYHVINGNASSSNFGNGYIKTNATESYSGEENFIDVYVNVDGGISLNAEANVIEPDIEANNGTVHFVDAVLVLPTIEGLTVSNPDFSNLVDALAQENLLNALSTNPQTSPAPLTLFAPNNNAFDSFIAEDNGFDDLQSILDSPLLSDVLTYHVLPDGALRANDITDGITPTTLQGDTFTINVGDDITITDQNDRVTNVSLTDITAANGVMHVIDNLLLPGLD